MFNMEQTTQTEKLVIEVDVHKKYILPLHFEEMDEGLKNLSQIKKGHPWFLFLS